VQHPPPILIDGVSKQFGDTVALDRVSLEVHAGEVFGLLGPNGAGKTTLIRTILDLIKPDSGRVQIFGRAFAPEDRNRVGYLPEERGLYPRQKIRAVLEYLAALKGLAPSAARAETARWLARFELADAAEQNVEQLSKGNQQKIQIIATLVASPAIVILDEPLSGLDPLSARMVMRVIRECAAEGRTIVLSTHQMGTVEALCARVFMIAHGRRVLYGNLGDIKREHSADAVRVQSSADYTKCPLVARVSDADGKDQPIEVYLHDGASGDDFLRWLVASDASIQSFERLTMPLEEIFVRVVERLQAAV
jgi:ABC-2 type transport system ATP-binding protein